MMEAHSDEEREKAQQEVEVLRGLDHPCIVRYHEHFVHDDNLNVVMHYCEGGDLSAHIKQRAKHEQYFQEDEALDLFVQIVMALHYVHNKRILHRDLKTQNIFISRGRDGSMGLVKLGDFGIAKVRSGPLALSTPAVHVSLLSRLSSRGSFFVARAGARGLVRGRLDRHRHSLLHVTGGLPGSELWLHERCMGLGMYPL